MSTYNALVMETLQPIEHCRSIDSDNEMKIPRYFHAGLKRERCIHKNKYYSYIYSTVEPKRIIYAPCLYTNNGILFKVTFDLETPIKQVF